MPGPLLTLDVHTRLRQAAARGVPALACSLDLGRSTGTVELHEATWTWQGQRFPYLEVCKDRTIYHWDHNAFAPVARYTTALIKLVPTVYGPPTFEIDGVKMLPTAAGSPYADAQRKVDLIAPRGKRVLDTCGGLGYFAAWCLAGGAAKVISFEKHPDVLWLRAMNPWSPAEDPGLMLTAGDITQEILALSDASMDAVLHDPPRFGLAGELYSAQFYAQLWRVMTRGGRLFHYTGSPNKLTSGRDVPAEVTRRLRGAGFLTDYAADGVLATKR